ncbi:MAG TPA: hypothetical protein VMS77_01050 [Conexivisphaerales archaeon]|nr:hypothetical protein [Conexivisphaerales archaeon]
MLGTLLGVSALTFFLIPKTIAGLKTFYDVFPGVLSIVIGVAIISIAMQPTSDLILKSIEKNSRLEMRWPLMLGGALALFVISVLEISDLPVLPQYGAAISQLVLSTVMLTGVYVVCTGFLVKYVGKGAVDTRMLLVGPGTSLTLLILQYIPLVQIGLQILAGTPWNLLLILWAAGIIVSRRWILPGLAVVAGTSLASALQGKYAD